MAAFMALHLGGAALVATALIVTVLIVTTLFVTTLAAPASSATTLVVIG
jgi:hypothetical protein